ncbi:MAG: DUF3553 domain-containing protein, partial [Kiloniellales bacterium]
ARQPTARLAIMMERLTPGTYVRHPERPDWGLGQVQSAIGERVTVNFEHAGKQLIDSRRVSLFVVVDEAMKGDRH